MRPQTSKTTPTKPAARTATKRRSAAAEAAKERAEAPKRAAKNLELRELGYTWSEIAAHYIKERPGINRRKAYRWAHDLTQQGVADRINQNDSGRPTKEPQRVADHETGRRNPSLAYLENLAKIFETNAQDLLTPAELATYPPGARAIIERIDYRHLDANHRARPLPVAHPELADHDKLRRPVGPDPDPSTLPDTSSGHSIQSAKTPQPQIDQVLAIAASGTGNTVRATADNLGEIVHHYSRELFQGHPADSYAQLTLARQFAGTVLDGAGSTSTGTQDLAAATGWISTLLAMAASHQGHNAASLIWSSDAERMSTRSGNPEIAAWAALTRAVTAYYQGDVRTSATIARTAQRLSVKGSAVHAKLASHEMRSWAAAGDLEAMMQARQIATESIARHTASATGSVFSLVSSEDPPYTATSFLALGRYKDALITTNRVLESGYRAIAGNSTKYPTSYARTLMILALAHVGLGDPEAAADIGHKALSSAPEVWPTLVLARRLDSQLYHDFGRTPVAQGFRVRYLQAVDANKLAEFQDDGR